MNVAVASYNIHRCYGRDGRYDPVRIRKVLRQLGAQVIALQEVELLHDAPGLLDFFCEGSSWRSIPGLTMTRANGEYGNALLTSLPVQSVGRIDLSQPGFEQRGALRIGLEHHGVQLDVVATHLGLRGRERVLQVKRLLEAIKPDDNPPADPAITVLMGDLNEWFRWGRSGHQLREYFDDVASAATFPSGFPLFPLDRILVKPPGVLGGIKVIRNEMTRKASDHLPVVATLGLHSVSDSDKTECVPRVQADSASLDRRNGK